MVICLAIVILNKITTNNEIIVEYNNNYSDFSLLISEYQTYMNKKFNYI